MTVSKFTHNACFGCILAIAVGLTTGCRLGGRFPVLPSSNIIIIKLFEIIVFSIISLSYYLILNLFSTLALLRNTNYLLERYSDNGNALRFPPCDGSYHADHGFLAPVGATYVSIVVGFVTKFYIVSGFPKKRFGSL